MKTNPLKADALTGDAAGSGKVSRKLARERAMEVAVSHGRTVQDVSKSDWEQAKRELTSGPDTDSQEAARVSVAESEGWGPTPGSTGHKVPVPSGDDEDAEGRSDVERLVVEGVREAGRQQMREADREAEKEG